MNKKKTKPKIIDKKSTFIDKNVKFGEDVVIYPNNIIKGDTYIGNNTIISYGNYIENSTILDNCHIEYSHIVESEVQDNCSVGPFSRLRPKSKVGANCKIGNFVEIKNSRLKEGSKASHLAYIGDADIGSNCNIGCGAIFVNYNGKTKNRTTVGDNCFIGSNVNIIAPVNLADSTYVCAGTTITKDTSNDDFVIGRARETIKPNTAHKYLKEHK